VSRISRGAVRDVENYELHLVAVAGVATLFTHTHQVTVLVVLVVEMEI
jgi:hypothetical protein